MLQHIIWLQKVWSPHSWFWLQSLNASQMSYEWPALFLDTVEWVQHPQVQTEVFFIVFFICIKIISRTYLQSESMYESFDFIKSYLFSLDSSINRLESRGDIMSTSGLSHEMRNICFHISLKSLWIIDLFFKISETRSIFPRGECLLSLDDESDGVWQKVNTVIS